MTTPTFTVEYLPEKHDRKINYRNDVIVYSQVEIRKTFTNQGTEVGYLVKVQGIFRRFRYDRIQSITPELI